MKITGLTSLKINKLDKSQYKEALTAGSINENEFYVIPDNTINANQAVITIPAGRMRGDIDGDGKITENDSLLLERHIAKWEGYELTDETQLLCADFDADGSVNITDEAFLKYIVNGFYKPGTSSDILNNWNRNPNYDTEDGQFYTDVTIDGMTADDSASVIIRGTFENGFFTKAECVNNAIRIYAKLCPITTNEAVVIWGEGDGSAVITTESVDLTTYNEHISNSAIHLPEVTADNDNNKILQVVDGAWTAATLPTTTTVVTTLSAANWDSTEKVYSFEADYPSDTYDIEVTIDGDNCTEEQIDAWTEATLLSSLTNKIIAMGDVPSIDIPILLTVIPK